MTQADVGDNATRGYGDNVIRFDDVLDGITPVRIRSGAGEDHFAVWTLNAYLGQQDLMVNTVGAYEGVRALGWSGPVAGLQIESGGPWSIEFLDPELLPVLTVGLHRLIGDDVLLMSSDFTPSVGALLADVRAAAEGHFAIAAQGPGADLLVNSVGDYQGRVIIPPGTQMLIIDSDGVCEIDVLDEEVPVPGESERTGPPSLSDLNLPAQLAQLGGLARRRFTDRPRIRCRKIPTVGRQRLTQSSTINPRLSSVCAAQVSTDDLRDGSAA